MPAKTRMVRLTGEALAILEDVREQAAAASGLRATYSDAVRLLNKRATATKDLNVAP